MASEEYICISNSDRPPLPGATRIGDIGDDEIVDATLRVRARMAEPSAAQTEALSLKPVAQRRYLSRDEYAASYGASDDSLSAIEAFAGRRGLQVVRANVAERSIEICGTAKTMAQAFRVKFGRYQAEGQTYRGYEGLIQMPVKLASTVESIAGFDDRQIAAPRSESAGQSDDGSKPATSP